MSMPLQPDGVIKTPSIGAQRDALGQTIGSNSPINFKSVYKIDDLPP